jgi:P4 family phage/plasmid primase-like protien
VSTPENAHQLPVKSEQHRVEYFTQPNLAAVLVKERFEGHYRWAKGLGWLAWDGCRWAEIPEETVIEVARLWVLAKLDQSIADLRTGRTPDAAQVTRWHSASKSAAGLRAIVALAKGIAGVITPAGDFDADPDLLNTATGVVDLRTGALQPHHPDLLMTRMTRAGYLPDRAHPIHAALDWVTALAAIPEDCHAYAQLRYGQAITGHMTPDDVLLVQQGSGENGKTTVMGAIATALGDYYTNVSDRVLLANPSDHPTELMDLRGARLALIEETPEARRLSVARLKRVVGTPRITARRIRQDSVTYDATHTLIVSTNNTPIIEETDHGTWRRLHLLRYPYRFRKPHEQLEHATDRHGDPGLRDRVCRADAGAAVLSWLVDGAVSWYARDRVMPAPPPRVASDSRAWRHEADQVLAYADDRLIIDRDAHVMATELLGDFNDWLRAHGHREWSDKILVSRFAGHDQFSTLIEKKKVRQRAGLSRPAVAWSGIAHSHPPATYPAWLGVRFRRADDLDAAAMEAPKSGDVPAVPGSPVNTKESPI